MIPDRLDADVATLRRFNRLYTQRIGLLNRTLEMSPFSLAEARILYELAHRAAPTAAEIGRALTLDRAQLSRTLKRFTAAGLVETGAHASGGRRRTLGLTPAGRAAFAALETNTNATVTALLSGLPDQARLDVMAAVHRFSTLLDPKPPAAPRLRSLQTGDLGWIVHRQCVLYAQEQGWNHRYEVLCAKILADFVDRFDPDHDAAWIAERDGHIVGSVFLVHTDRPHIGQLRLLYVEPDMRRFGLGRVLVEACIERARACGYQSLILWTNSVLTAARRLYERAGFTLIDEASHHSFGQDLVGQTWSLDLGSAPPAAPDPEALNFQHPRLQSRA